MKLFVVSILLSLLLFVVPTLPSQAPLAAEYQGSDIDGTMYDASAFSYSTGKYYSVQVEFSGDEALVYFSNGGHITLTLDDEEIDDPHDISAFDYNKGAYWDLDVDGLD
jgi:hypothetical protein